MSEPKVANRAYVETATVGTGSTIIFGAPVGGYQGFHDNDHITSNDEVVYGIEDGTEWEIGTGKLFFNGTAWELQDRTPSDSSNGGSAINLSGTAKVFGTARQEDLFGDAITRYGNTIFVDVSGDGENSGRNPQHPTTLGNANSTVNAGDTILVYRGQYPGSTIVQRNIAIVGMGMVGASGQFPVIDNLVVNAGGIKLGNIHFYNGLTIDTTDAFGIGSHLSAVQTDGLTITGDQFLEADDVKVYASGGNSTTIGGSAARFFYGSEFEAGITANGTGLLYVQDSISGPITATAGTLVLRDITATASNAPLVIGPGVVYSLQGVGGFDVQIDPAAINITDANIIGGLTEAQAQQASEVWFEGLKSFGLHLGGRITLDEETLSDIAADGAVPAAALDRAAGIVFSQTTAGVSVTLSAPTDATDPRVLHIRNSGSEAINVEGVEVGAGAISMAMWSGSAWTVFQGGGGEAGIVDVLEMSHGNATNPIVLTTTVAAKTAQHPYAGVGSTDAFYINGNESPAMKLAGVDPSAKYYYRFDQSDASNAGHPLLFYTDPAKTLQHTAGVTTNGTPGSAGAYTEIAVDENTPKILFYQCQNHAYMGNYAETPVPASAAAGGSVQPTVQTITGASGATALDLATYNWFEVTPGDDATLVPSLAAQDPHAFDVVVTNDEEVTAGATPVQFDFRQFSSYDGIIGGDVLANRSGDVFMKPDGTRFYMVEYTGGRVRQYDATVPFDIGSETGSYFFASNAPVSVTWGLWFKPDGLKMYIGAYSSPGSIYEFNLGTAWDVTTAVYTNKSFNPGVVGANIAFSPDGLTLIVGPYSADEIRQYSLGTAWDISTVNSTPVNTITYRDAPGWPGSAQAGGISTTSDGLKMFVSAYIDNNYESGFTEYSLTTPFDLSTASVVKFHRLYGDVGNDGSGGIHVMDDGKTLMTGDYYNYTIRTYNIETKGIEFSSWVGGRKDVSSESDVPFAICFNSDGTKMYLGGRDSNNSSFDGVFEYELKEPYKISTAVYAQRFKSTNSVRPVGLHMRPGDTELFLLDDSETLTRFTLSVPGDIESAVGQESFSVSGQLGDAYDLVFKPDGTKFYVASVNVERIYEYDLSTPWLLSTASYSGNFGSTAAFAPSNLSGFVIKPDGVTALAVSNGNDRIGQFTMSAPWDISTLAYDNVFYDISASSNPTSLQVTPDGKGLVVTDASAPDSVFQINLDTAWDISTASYEPGLLDVSAQDGTPLGLHFKPDGTKFYVVGNDNDRVYEYQMNTPWRVSSGFYTGSSFSTLGQTAFPNDMHFKPDGLAMYVHDSSAVYQYSLGTAWDLSSVSFTKSLSIPDASVRSILFSPTGDRFYVHIEVLGEVHQYDMSTPWEIDTATKSGAIDVSPLYNDDLSLSISQDGFKLYLGQFGAEKLSEVTLTTAFDITTAQLGADEVATFDFQAVTGNISFGGIFFKPDGQKFYVSSYNPRNVIYEFDAVPGQIRTPYQIDFFPNIVWDGGSAPAQSPTGDKDWYRFETANGGSKWFGKIIDQGF